MKFQHLILPLVLWLVVFFYMWFFVPTSPLVVGGLIVLISIAAYFSARLIAHDHLPMIVTCGVCLFFISSVFSGFNFINLLLIVAMGTALTLLTTKR